MRFDWRVECDVLCVYYSLNNNHISPDGVRQLKEDTRVMRMDVL